MSARSRRPPVVLMYHSIAPYSDDPYNVPIRPDRFEQQMSWLDARGLRGVSMSTLLSARQRGSDAGLVGLTFDDGYHDFLRHVLLMLIRHGFGATAFLIADRIGGDNAWDKQGPRKPLLTASRVNEVAGASIEIGSHGLRHVDLRHITDLALVRELQDLTGSAVRGFCYPYGFLNRRVIDGVRGAGYEYGCAIWTSELTGAYAVPRVYVGDADGPARLRAKWLHHSLTWQKACRPADAGQPAGPALQPAAT